ncbi:MAG: hypothetical protein KKD99_13540, partial [Proteobacteria bacterium]|nr:hypothetical protein [Pseudomonadota bacterium]
QAALNQALSAITNTPDMPPIRLLIEDTCTDAGIAYDKMVEMRSNGCHIVLGPESSEECRILKTYANENDVLLISSSSTATPLALPDDNLMRLTIDDSNQARVLAELLTSDGISDIAILSRSDIYGEGFMAALIQEHNARGGTVFATNYCSRVTDFIPETVSNLATQVSTRIAVRGANRVGVVTILFDEGVDVLQQGASWPALYSVRWYGTDGMAQNRSLATNTLASAMAGYVGYTCPSFGRFTNALYGAVEAGISAELGIPVVPRYPMSSYDALWLAALAIQKTGGTNTMDELIAAIHSVATNYVGCTSPIAFNDADDRATGTYDMWSYRGDALGWVEGKVGPVVTVNQSDGPVTVQRGNEVAVAVEMCLPGNKLGMEADWWVAALTPAGWYYFGPDFKWHPENDSAKWFPACQGALGDLNSRAVLQSATLSAGDYTFYFGVDERNGKMDDGIWCDAVQLSVR